VYYTLVILDSQVKFTPLV